MTKMELRVFRFGLLVGMILLAGALVFSSLSHGTMSSPQYGSSFEFVEAELTQVDGAIAQAATKEKFRDDGSGSNGVWAYKFEDNPAIEKQLRFMIVPPRWRQFGEPSVPIALVSAEDTASCFYRLCVEYTLLEVGKPIAPFTATDCRTFSSNSSVSVRDVTLGPVPGVSTTLDPVLHGRIYRNNTDPLDTCDNKSLWVHVIGVAFRKDRPGSRTALEK
jgi:hypothetical protein